MRTLITLHSGLEAQWVRAHSQAIVPCDWRAIIYVNVTSSTEMVEGLLAPLKHFSLATARTVGLGEVLLTA